MAREKGFSLLETIAAILLLAVAFGAVMQVAGAAMHLTSTAQARSRAAMWADSKLEALGIVEPLSPGVTEGRFDKAFRWKLVVTPAALDTTDLHLYRIDLDVLWGDSAQPARMRFTTLRLRDTPTKPTAEAGT